jgi:hypothetical protein
MRVRPFGTKVEVPDGLRVKPVGSSRTGWYFLDEFPFDVFPRDSFERHDAIHYGLVIQEEHTVEVRS